jgi:glycosyltransferase involved in cell wall biosynthesis
MCNSFFYLRGGSERCFFGLSDLLSAHGHKVIPFAMHDERNLPSEYADYFVSHVDYPSLLRQGSSVATKMKVVGRVLYSGEAKAKIRRLIEDTKPDVAHVHGIAHEISPSILDAIKKTGVPIVQTLHDYYLLCPNTNFVSRGQICERCKRRRYYQVVLRRCKRGSLAASLLAGLELTCHKLVRIYERNVDTFVSPSKFLKRKVAEYGINNTVRHVPNFVDLEQFQPEYEAADYFVYLGRLTGVKGVMTLVEAMRCVKQSHLYIVGEGELRADLEAYAAQHGISNVSFSGHLGTEDLIPLVQRAAFTVVPSEWYENYPMSVLESLACGTPVIGSELGGIPELIGHGDTGLLFKAGDAEQLADRIRFLLDRPERAVEMGRRGRQQVEAVNHPEYHYEQTMLIYNGLMSVSRRDSRALVAA